MQSRLGVASFVIGIAIGVAYAVVRILLVSPPDYTTALAENLSFMIGASIASVVGLVLGVTGWVRGHKAGRKTGLAIVGSALNLAVIGWAIAVWIPFFTMPVQTNAG